MRYSRNLRKRALILLVVMLFLVNLLMQGSIYQLGKAGWLQFVTRGAGVGATPGG